MFAWATPYLLWIKLGLVAALGAASLAAGWEICSWRAAANLQEQKDAVGEELRKVNSSPQGHARSGSHRHSAADDRNAQGRPQDRRPARG